jgi:ubiquinone biosynthesis monooxygenase Coq7
MDPVTAAARQDPVDDLVFIADRWLRAIAGVACSAVEFPGDDVAPPDQASRLEVAAMMRVNHAGELCAQSLYLAQALLARDARLREHFLGSADEEAEHLAWMQMRLAELGGRRSLLDPLWLAGAAAIAAAFAAAGDRSSLAFLRETELQVARHLDGHLARLPIGDLRSRAILERMRDDEQRHGDSARKLGAGELPLALRIAMKAAARVMTGVAARI